MKFLRTWYAAAAQCVHSPYATISLAFLFFIEATIFIFPIDPLLMLFCLEQRDRSLYYATIATVSSVLGGMFGYTLGYTLWQTCGSFFTTYIITPHLFTQVVHWFTNYEALTILIAGFTPIPYKAVTIGAGFCKLPLLPFIGYSLISRGARFFLLAGIIYKKGTLIKEFIEKYFDILVIVISCIIILGIWFISMMWK